MQGYLLNGAGFIVKWHRFIATSARNSSGFSVLNIKLCINKTTTLGFTQSRSATWFVVIFFGEFFNGE